MYFLGYAAILIVYVGSLRQRLVFKASKNLSTAIEVGIDINLRLESKIGIKRLKSNMKEVFACVNTQYDGQLKSMRQFLYESEKQFTKTAWGHRKLDSANSMKLIFGENALDSRFMLKMVHFIDIRMKFDRFFKHIYQKKPFARGQKFRKFIEIVIVFLNLGLPGIVVASGLVFVATDLEEQDYLRYVNIVNHKRKVSDKVNCFNFLLATLSSLVFWNWYSVMVSSLSFEGRVWCREVLEGLHMSIAICKNQKAILQDDMATRKYMMAIAKVKADIEKNNDMFIPYFDPLNGPKQHFFPRLVFVQQLTNDERFENLYTTYINLRLMHKFVFEDSKELKEVAKMCMVGFVFSLLASTFLGLGNMNRSRFLIFTFLLIAFSIIVQVQTYNCFAVDSEVS